MMNIKKAVGIGTVGLLTLGGSAFGIALSSGVASASGSATTSPTVVIPSADVNSQVDAGLNVQSGLNLQTGLQDVSQSGAPDATEGVSTGVISSETTSAGQ